MKLPCRERQGRIQTSRRRTRQLGRIARPAACFPLRAFRRGKAPSGDRSRRSSCRAAQTRHRPVPLPDNSAELIGRTGIVADDMLANVSVYRLRMLCRQERIGHFRRNLLWWHWRYHSSRICCRGPKRSGDYSQRRSASRNRNAPQHIGVSHTNLRQAEVT
jgi:hypothetical protein